MQVLFQMAVLVWNHFDLVVKFSGVTHLKSNELPWGSLWWTLSLFLCPVASVNSLVHSFAIYIYLLTCFPLPNGQTSWCLMAEGHLESKWLKNTLRLRKWKLSPASQTCSEGYIFLLLHATVVFLCIFGVWGVLTRLAPVCGTYQSTTNSK